MNDDDFTLWAQELPGPGASRPGPVPRFYGRRSPARLRPGYHWCSWCPDPVTIAHTWQTCPNRAAAERAASS
jgi:hypothetical protein